VPNEFVQLVACRTMGLLKGSHRPPAALPFLRLERDHGWGAVDGELGDGDGRCGWVGGGGENGAS